MQYLQVLFEAACSSEHLETSLKKKLVKNDVALAKKLFQGGGLKGGVTKKMFFLKLKSVQSLSRPFLCLGI